MPSAAMRRRDVGRQLPRMTPRKLAAIAAVHQSVENAAFDFGGEALNSAFRETRAADALLAQALLL